MYLPEIINRCKHKCRCSKAPKAINKTIETSISLAENNEFLAAVRHWWEDRYLESIYKSKGENPPAVSRNSIRFILDYYQCHALKTYSRTLKAFCMIECLKVSLKRPVQIRYISTGIRHFFCLSKWWVIRKEKPKATWIKIEWKITDRGRIKKEISRKKGEFQEECRTLCQKKLYKEAN